MNAVDPGPLRRLLLIAFVLAATAAATQLLTHALGVDGLSVAGDRHPGGVRLTFALALLCASATALAGFLVHLTRDVGALTTDRLIRAPGGPAAGRTALVMPIYHEDPERVAARLRGDRALARRHRPAGRFDLFILSDSRDPEPVRAEQAVWARLCSELGAGRPGVLSQPRRQPAAARPATSPSSAGAGAPATRYFVVLDADSVMSGETLVRLVGLMEANPRAGLIQTLPQPVGGETLFARVAAVRGPALRPGLRRRRWPTGIPAAATTGATTRSSAPRPS